MIKESICYLFVSIIFLFFSINAFAKNSIDSCIHLTPHIRDTLFYDKAKVIKGDKSEIQIKFPHPQVCKLYNLKCKERVIKPNEIVAIGNICEDSVFIQVVNRTLVENGYTASISGWVNKNKLHFIKETENERIKRKKRRYERVNKENPLINAKYFKSPYIPLHDKDITLASLETKLEALEYGILRNDIDFIQKLAIDKKLFSDSTSCRFLLKATYSDPAILELLISKGLNVNCSKNLITPLISTAGMRASKGSVLKWYRLGHSYNIKPRPIKTAKLLIENGAKVNREIKLSSNVSALNSAISVNNIEMMNFLIENGADVNDYVVKKWQKAPTSLMYAIKKYRGDPSAIDLLILSGADLNYKSKFGYNHVCEKTTSGRCPYNGQTALTLAVQHNYYPIVKLLLDNGADPLLCRRTKRKDGCPITIAKKNGNKELEELISKYIK